MYLLDHLTPEDKAIVLEKTARFLADSIATQQQAAILYDSQQALATRLKCSVDTVGQLFAEQRIHYVRLGQKGYRVTEEAVLEFLRPAA